MRSSRILFSHVYMTSRRCHTSHRITSCRFGEQNMAHHTMKIRKRKYEFFCLLDALQGTARRLQSEKKINKTIFARISIFECDGICDANFTSNNFIHSGTASDVNSEKLCVIKKIYIVDMLRTREKKKWSVAKFFDGKKGQVENSNWKISWWKSFAKWNETLELRGSFVGLHLKS